MLFKTKTFLISTRVPLSMKCKLTARARYYVHLRARTWLVFHLRSGKDLALYYERSVEKNLRETMTEDAEARRKKKEAKRKDRLTYHPLAIDASARPNNCLLDFSSLEDTKHSDDGLGGPGRTDPQLIADILEEEQQTIRLRPRVLMCVTLFFFLLIVIVTTIILGVDPSDYLWSIQIGRGPNKMSKAVVLLLTICLVTLANGQGTLLEMSQQLWAKLLSGGFSKAGKLDPLRVPVIKVDQSEGDTSYRIILKNVEIVGLNESTLESIHIARGRLKSNLSELEAGYVSYSDLRDLDSIRYRFHTLIKEPKTQNESFEAIVSATGQDSKFSASSPEQESRLERMRQYDPFLLKIQADKMREESAELREKKTQSSTFGTFSMEGARVVSRPESARITMNSKVPSDVHLVYSMSPTNSGPNSRNYERKDSYDRPRPAFYPGRGQGSTQQEDRRESFSAGRAEERYEDDAQTSASENFESRVKGQDPRIPGFPIRNQGFQGESRLEKQPGYIDIVYADGYNGNVRRFGNGRIEGKDAQVYGIKDVEKDILENRRVISRNCTEGESLTKRNEEVKAAIAAKNLEGLSRYAKNYQEKQGFFEEGMQLIYHYGGMGSNNSKNVKGGLGTRHKRAHRDNETDDDVMHVILKIRVPMLRIKSDYQLMGKVGKELVRGNGKLNGNFSDVLADFTIELKKLKDQGILIVRAARSKLEGKKQNLSLQGMDEKGPVKSILSHGLMAAEAVAAMLADDLATKALNDKTADAMIYRMYKNLPVN
ncbi:uncharacterized protein LOC143181383 [Calliopsis andreniformis]|uniref:uncharacterized protein LOC143181383 n=1 Tax=Calliopsis andreniformis TaxID=337506 RepID=UPI003FCDAA26